MFACSYDSAFSNIEFLAVTISPIGAAIEGFLKALGVIVFEGDVVSKK